MSRTTINVLMCCILGTFLVALSCATGEKQPKTQAGDDSLVSAVNAGDAEAVKRLLRHGANPNIFDSKGSSPLAAACYKGDMEIVKILLNNKADPNGKDPQYQTTALHAAASAGKPEVVKLLLDNAANVNARTTPDGTTPLFAALMKDSNIAVIRLLIEAGADVNAQHQIGLTALMMASAKGYSDVVTVLLKSGADPAIKSSTGGTALSYALDKGHDKVAEILRRDGSAVKGGPDAQTPISEFRWIDGYLEKEYMEVGAVDEADGIPGMFDKCVAVSTTILEDKSGYIRANGVGDSKGKWRNWSGVGTFSNLNVPDGGVIVYVKIKGKTISFKFSEGDRRSSEVLHNILADRIKTIDQRYPPLSEKQFERVSKIRNTFEFLNPQPMDSFIWRYRRAEDPEEKITIHEAMAKTLAEYSTGKDLSVDEKKELLTIIEKGVNSGPDEAIRSLELKTFTEAQAREILAILGNKLSNNAAPKKQISE
jgi:ankyrin repeat protein